MLSVLGHCPGRSRLLPQQRFLPADKAPWGLLALGFPEPG